MNEQQENKKALSENPDAILPAQTEPKKDLVSTAKNFWNAAFGKNTDLSATIEQFTSEMTLVIEGLSDDQTHLNDLLDQLSADETQLEAYTREEVKALKTRTKELENRLTAQEKELEALKKREESKKERRKPGLSEILKQATVLVGILAGAWVIVTILNLFK